jgi:dihydrolipoamide dehydrogenase
MVMNIIVIGGGPAGRTAAIEASNIEEDVILIERDKIGGKCLNEGCMVVCGLNDVARFLIDAENFHKFGVTFKDREISYVQVANGIKETIGRIREILEIETKEAGVKVVKGNASIHDKKVVVDSKDVDDNEYEYDKLIIATGSRPFIPPIEGSKNAKTYSNLLDFTEIPEKMVIIGGGVMAAEFAGIFSALGSDVHILCDYEFLGMLDADIKKYVLDNLLASVDIHENVRVTEISENGAYINEEEFKGEVLLATGMTPNSEIVKEMVNIGSKNEIVVNERMETNHKDIYAAGDVVAGIGNTPVARMEGVVAARNACGIASEVDYRFIPYAISLYYDIGFLGSENTDNSSEGYIPGSAGPGSFWNVLDGRTGLTKTSVDLKTGAIKKLFSISPSARTSMAYMSKLLRDDYKTHDFDDFVETHPSTDAVYKLMRFFAKF